MYYIRALIYDLLSFYLVTDIPKRGLGLALNSEHKKGVNYYKKKNRL